MDEMRVSAQKSLIDRFAQGGMQVMITETRPVPARRAPDERGGTTQVPWQVAEARPQPAAGGRLAASPRARMLRTLRRRHLT